MKAILFFIVVFLGYDAVHSYVWLSTFGETYCLHHGNLKMAVTGSSTAS
jgi:hypothetical protein